MEVEFLLWPLSLEFLNRMTVQLHGIGLLKKMGTICLVLFASFRAMKQDKQLDGDQGHRLNVSVRLNM